MRKQITFNTDFEWKYSFGITMQEAQKIINANCGDVLKIDNNQVTLRFSEYDMTYEKLSADGKYKSETLNLSHVRQVLEENFSITRTV